MPLKFLHVAAVMVAVTLIALPRNAMAETGPLLVELNKTEEIDGGGCRAFFLFRNQTGKSFAGFEMSLAILDAGGVIDRLLSVDAAPLPVQRTILKLFEIPDIACGNISEILLHDITSCQPQNEEQMDCFPILNLESRAAAQLVK
ncbi:MAG: hypothetical protein P1U91_17020 [Pseudophaeobacter sp. bin_em_oilr2.035]|uniref:Tat pathway signal protein n=1 Tax=Phaeobacter gallaeciensis TaxID=60890 RepID=A0ABD4XDA1_9RHOB|nr:hypothetical protein [Phaeobacter gallaeciensis]MDF1773659.1 hypothetical protein [Pseudophaeobacter sp. bin_em_oilr2.035]MDE4146046.1 hypothetical protein [Phaeobacter gallaeciensis]MDE4158719.1 hypothetical protein [Phaeobacter gallaeciensis]MDE4162896.1 hypothetical protein [Phaeobacter gallaeciensis]MDE4167124.1 hypothetical protein [Phaeobacter gallaeciensis]